MYNTERYICNGVIYLFSRASKYREQSESNISSNKQAYKLLELEIVTPLLDIQIEQFTDFSSVQRRNSPTDILETVSWRQY